MKKKLLSALSLVLAVSVMAGCTSNIPKDKADGENKTENVQEEAKDTAQASDEGSSEDNTADDSAQVSEGAVKTGLGVITSLGSSKEAGDEDGLAQVESMIAAVTVDADGKIVNCVIDGVQSKINFTKEGKLSTDVSTTFSTKNELGTEYGMSQASSIGKEWNEQAEAFAQYVVGKTADEVGGIAVTEEGLAGDADLAAGVTVHIGDFISVVEKAVSNAQDLGASAADKLGLSVGTKISDSKDAAADANGAAQAYSTFSVVTLDGEGKITSCIIDASQGQVDFDAAGKIVSDISAKVSTKNKLGAEYGMAKASSIGKEWNEQAAAYAAFATGKTVEEVKGVAVNEGVPSDADLAASVTIHVTEFNEIIEKAASSAK